MRELFIRITGLLLMPAILQACAAKMHQGGEIELSNVKSVARVTGKTLEGENLPDPNNTSEKYDVGGTDLGIMWDMGNNKIGIFFGDTNGKDFKPQKGGGNGSNWRSNVLGFSSDNDLEDGLTLDSMNLDEQGRAREICAGAAANPSPSDYYTSIPTGAIHAGGADYVHYMNIYKWEAPKGRWPTHFSSLYASYDGGVNWVREAGVTFKSDSKFSQVCYTKKDGYVYMLGTLSGRGSGAWLARFREKDILNMANYEYWNGNLDKWIKGDENTATEVIPAPVGEASLLYHEKYKRWIITYIYDFHHDANPVIKRHALVYRSAKTLTGPWSNIKLITTAKEYPGLYSPYMHPLKNKGDKIYFTMSLWQPYNVFLMSADINIK
ncbi:MAG: DUF4185 domain-containing protein [Niabella sp.]